MTVLFNLVLLFCSRDFIEFYAEIKRRGDLNRDALAYYFSNFIIKAGFWGGLFGMFVSNWWGAEGLDFTLNGPRLGIFVLVFIILLVSLRWEARQIESQAFIYSDGALAEATITEKYFWKGHRYKFKYSVAGRNYEFEKNLGLLAGVDSLGSVGETFVLIHTKSDPNFVDLYHGVNFSKRCLIKNKIPPVLKGPGKGQVQILDGSCS